jgi:hypothetical protein
MRIVTHLAPGLGAPGPHDFAVPECAARPRHIPVHRIPHHVRDDAYAPSSAAECGATNRYFRKSESKIFFARGLDNPNQLEPSSKMDFPRTQFLNGFLHRCGGAGAKPN